MFQCSVSALTLLSVSRLPEPLSGPAHLVTDRCGLVELTLSTRGESLQPGYLFQYVQECGGRSTVIGPR